MKRFEFDPYETLRRVRAEMAEAEHKNSSEAFLAAIPAIPSAFRALRVAEIAGIATSSAPREEIAEALDHFEERAAIREYDGGQPRSEAEREALIEAARAVGIEVIDLRAAIAARRKE